MIYYQVGVVKYKPRAFREGWADYSDYYEMGETVPIILYFAESPLEDYVRQEHVVWMENTIPNLKPGDPICVNLQHEQMYKIITDSRGVRIGENN